MIVYQNFLLPRSKIKYCLNVKNTLERNATERLKINANCETAWMMKSGGGTAKVISGKKRRVMRNGRRVSGMRE